MRTLPTAQEALIDAAQTTPIFLVSLGIEGTQMLSTGGDYTTPGITATGGTTTDIIDGGVSYRVHTFNSSGTFAVTGSGEVEYLMIGGGGGGGSRHGGGGGGGGWKSGTAAVTTGNYTLTRGAGGAAGVASSTTGGNGGNSSAFGITALGGGGGASFSINSNNGRNGASGGGAASDTGSPGLGTAGQGYNGGTLAAGNWPGTGGGGQAQAGFSNVSGAGGNGGSGLPFTITGTTVYRGGGGGGAGETTAGTGGLGGGGAGSIGDNNPVAGTANTGGGGGGRRSSSGSGNGAAGGTGIVLVRYPLTTVSFTASDLRVSSIENWMRATLEFVPDPTKIQNITDNDWARAPCSIWLLPSRTSMPILLLDGIVTDAHADHSKVVYTVSHKAVSGRWTPRIRMTSQWLNHMPEPGTRFLWQGDVYILESR